MRILTSTLIASLMAVSGIAQSLTELYKKVNPSVVVIYTDSKQAAGGGSRLNTVSAQGIGSGVLIDDNNWYIMTAAHVVQGADKIRVTFSSGEDVPAQIVSSIPKADVALLKLDWKPLETKVSAVPLGNSDDVKVGDDVFVIGAPMGLEHSLSRGIVSGHHHMDKVSSSGKKMDFLQTDASINQGNSGGPMFNMKGEVVGLASFILTQSGGFEGIGFAATSNIAKDLLLERSRFWSGLENVFLPEELAKALNVPQNGGLLVQNVVPRSMGGKMGLQGGYFRANIEGVELLLGGDVLLSLNDIPMTSEENMEKIWSVLSEMAPGTSFTLSVLREGKVIALKGSLPVN
ncbi:MAG: S1C family serine protease [Salibacteraceae bacterium]